MRVVITNKPFNPEKAHADFREAIGDAGAIVAFTGIVRADRGVSKLTLEYFPDFTEAEIQRIGKVAENRWALKDWIIIHRIGDLAIGEPIVFVASASKHRRAAFEATDFLMDYLKSEAPFWKKEWRGSEAIWIDPRAEDFTDKARWET